ncbi:hypothetical protein Afil01_11740 [Actinorhabdospora filicis]|uniref:Lytic transglycosylase domain-containing protein n=1 Tax=Actinorhabdospora filicis TaxID=1785913 RepID=A0A9W6SIC1_9ACTN|nr:lytic transglycosylase domain-containing protein [Actinorhabdospora filicis]GLZ76367.1 hypothetical protein Afil01_11740 [Actinorhabdospora filicis]
MLFNRDRFTTLKSALSESGKLRYATLGVTGLLVIGAALLGVTSAGDPTPASALAGDARTVDDQAARGTERSQEPTPSTPATPTPDPTKSTPEPAKATEKPVEEPKKPANEGGGSGDNVDIPADCSNLSGSRAIGCAVMLDSGFGMNQWSCLNTLWDHESGWNVHAENPSSGAYGIPQALPGSKMASAGGDWQNSAATQVKWGLGYIKGRYGSPCGAWGYWQSNGWY